MLKKLNLSDNQITSLPESFKYLISLEELNLSRNQLTTLPENLGNLSSLTSLYSSKNDLSTLPDSIGRLITLKILFLNENQLTTLPEFIGNLTSLENLEIGGNNLTALPESFGNLSSLTELNLNENQLTTLPESFKNLSSLLHLFLSHNQLTREVELPPSLTWLVISSNKISSLESLSTILSLEKLDVRDNDLENFVGFPFFHGDSISFNFTQHREEILFKENPLRSLHGIPRHFLVRIIHQLSKYNRSGLFPNKERRNIIQKIGEFHFSPIGATLVQQCAFLSEKKKEEEKNMYIDNYETLYAYYLRSPTDLAESYAQDPRSLTEEEQNRLEHEGSGIERDILLTRLPSSDPVVKILTARLTISTKDGYSLVL